MKRTLKNTLRALLVVPALVLTIGATTLPAFAAGTDLTLQNGADASKGTNSQTCLFTTSTCTNGIFTTITNVLLFIIGAISVIMLIIGGIRYTVSGGDSAQVQGAKNTILYAIVGIVVAILAYAVVNFVISQFAGGN